MIRLCVSRSRSSLSLPEISYTVYYTCITKICIVTELLNYQVNIFDFPKNSTLAHPGFFLPVRFNIDIEPGIIIGTKHKIEFVRLFSFQKLVKWIAKISKSEWLHSLVIFFFFHVEKWINKQFHSKKDYES